MVRPAEANPPVAGPETGAGATGTILVALDGSAFGESALPHARALARVLGTPLHLVAVLDPSLTGGTVEGSAECRLQLLETERYLDRLARGLAAEGFETSHEVREGDPAHEVVAAGLERDAEFLVVASRPRRRSERLVSRGVAQGVVASGVLSLMVARGLGSGHGGAQSPAAYRTIAVGVDGSPASHRALRLAASLARSEDALLVLVHVLPGGVAASRVPRPRVRSSGEPRRDFEGPSEAGRYLEELERSLQGGGAGIRTVLCRSPQVADAVEATAREEGADLLVLGARGAGEAGTRYGRCARRLLGRAEMPVLVVRAERGVVGDVFARRRPSRGRERRRGRPRDRPVPQGS